MTARRPSLNALRAFEAAARLESMTAAAVELCVTHGAISRQIRALEELFDVLLFERGPHLVPTPAGARLAESLSTAFGLIDASLEQLKPGPLTLSCSATIMMYWLIPRIGRFYEKHPGIEVQFNLNYNQVDFVRDQISMAIRTSFIDAPKDVVMRNLMGEWIGPVCSPDYMKSNRLESIEDLSRAQRLLTHTRPGAWNDWAEAANVHDIELEAHQHFAHFYLLIQAAACGLGVAPVPKMLVSDDLRSGKLVAPFGFVRGPHNIVLWTAPHLNGRPEAHALSDWLADEMHETEAGISDWVDKIMVG